MKHPSPLIAILLTLPVGCIAVNERVLRSEEPAGEPREVGQRDLPAVPRAMADLDGDSLVITLRKDRPCQKKLEAVVQRRDQVLRELDPSCVMPMTAEFVGGMGAGLLGLLFVAVPSEVYTAGVAGKALTVLGLLGASGALLGAFGTHVYYLSQSPSTTTQESVESWAPVQTCRKEPLADTDVQVEIGAVKLGGKSDAEGRLRLRAPDGMDLGSLLAATSSRLKVRVKKPFLDVELSVLDTPPPSSSSAPSSPVDTQPNTAPSPGETTRSAPDPAHDHPADARSASAEPSDAPPAFFDAPPSGAQLDAVDEAAED